MAVLLGEKPMTFRTACQWGLAFPFIIGFLVFLFIQACPDSAIALVLLFHLMFALFYEIFPYLIFIALAQWQTKNKAELWLKRYSLIAPLIFTAVVLIFIALLVLIQQKPITFDMAIELMAFSLVKGYVTVLLIWLTYWLVNLIKRKI